jgi:hypothetical protein
MKISPGCAMAIVFPKHPKHPPYVTSRMAEAEAEGEPLAYAQVEGIIENDTDVR